MSAFCSSIKSIEKLKTINTKGKEEIKHDEKVKRERERGYDRFLMVMHTVVVTTGPWLGRTPSC